MALLMAYAGELEAGVSVPGRAEAQGRLNAILERHGQALSAVIGSIEGAEQAAPSFPPRTGVSDTFGYFGHFLPVAAITAVVELIFPLVLWAYTFWALAWDIHVRERSAETRTETSRQGADDSAHAAPSPARKSRRRAGKGGANPKGLNGARNPNAHKDDGEHGDAR